MKRISLLLIFIASLLPMDATNNLYLTPTIALQKDVSGHYAGIVNGELWIWGGCNFPKAPLAEGGTKQYYPIAYGASVVVPQGTFVIGGTAGNSSARETFLMKNIDHREYRTFFSQYDHSGRQNYPPLPVGLHNLAAAYDEKGGYIYAVGGQTDDMPNQRVFRLAWPQGKAWQLVGMMPDKARIQPVATIQNDPSGPCLYVFGGFSPTTATKRGFVHRDGLKLNLRTKHWKRLKWADDEQLPTVGATCANSGYSSIIFEGGVNSDIFTRAINNEEDSTTYYTHPVSWYQFNPDILVYNTFTDAWTALPGDSILARAGATLTPQKAYWFLSGGEMKPGIRTSDVQVIEIVNEKHFGWVNWTVLLLYLIGMLLLGVYFMRRESGAEDFFRGGGRVPWWAAGISIYATMLSAITYMAIPAKSFATNWTYYPMLITILLVSFPVIKYYLPYFRKLQVASAYEYLERRFNTATRLLASGIFIIFMIARMALVLYLPSLALSAVTGIDISLCIILMGIVTIVYCTMGGVEAVIWGDVIQGIILVGGAIFSMVYLIANTKGGFGGFIDIAVANDKFRLFNWSFDWRSATFWVVILGGIANNLISYTSDQTVIQRYMTTKNEKSAAKGILLNGVMSAFVSVVFYAIGTGLYTFFKTNPSELDITMQKADAIFPYFMMSQMPVGLAGLLIAAIFAATMSTISSNINSVSTAFSVDFYQRFCPQVKDSSLLRVARVTCIVSGVIGVAIALLMVTWNILSLFDYFNMILGLLTSGLGGLFMMGVFFPRIRGGAALTGFLTGVLVVLAISLYTNIHFLLYGAIGIVVSVMVGWLVSVLFNKQKS